MSEALTTIRLNGELGKKFGRVHHFAVQSVAEAVRAMSVMIPGFQAELMNSQDRGMSYAVFVGKENIGEQQLRNTSGGKTIKIAPVLQGSKGGLLQTILGIVLIVVGVWTENPALVSSGIAMTAGGVLQMLSPQQNISSKNNPANGTSYNFSGPTNTTVQGNPVPLLYGEMIVGSAVISAGIFADDESLIAGASPTQAAFPSLDGAYIPPP